MAYGYYGASITAQTKTIEEDDGKKKLNPTHGKQPQIFLAILVQVTFSVGAMGLCYSSGPWIEPGALAYILPWTLIVILFACCCPIVTGGVFMLSVQDEMKEDKSKMQKWRDTCYWTCFLSPIFLVGTAGFSAQAAAVDLFLMVSYSQMEGVIPYVILPFALVRRALLYAMILW